MKMGCKMAYRCTTTESRLKLVKYFPYETFYLAEIDFVACFAWTKYM